MDVISQREAGITVEPDENGNTFEENSYIKAKAVPAMTTEVIKIPQRIPFPKLLPCFLTISSVWGASPSDVIFSRSSDDWFNSDPSFPITYDLK